MARMQSGAEQSSLRSDRAKLGTDRDCTGRSDCVGGAGATIHFCGGRARAFRSFRIRGGRTPGGLRRFATKNCLLRRGLSGEEAAGPLGNQDLSKQCSGRFSFVAGAFDLATEAFGAVGAEHDAFEEDAVVGDPT